MNYTTHKFILREIYLISLLLFFVVDATAIAALPNGVSVTITPVKSAFIASDTITLDVSYTNTTANTLTILKWSTALEGRINSDFLNISHAGIKLDYLGRRYKRGTPNANDYVLLSSGESITARVNVNEAYSVTKKGIYDVAYIVENIIPSGLRTIGSASISFELLSDKLDVVLKRTPTFSSCTSGRQSAANSALSAAENIAAKAAADLRATPTSKRAAAQRYLEWFGTYNSTRWNKVQSNFNKISNAASNRTINFDCSCTSSSFAYVYPSQPYNIYLCNAFWSAQKTGTDSKAGTIIHELSHFTVVADTDDVVYGQNGARNLANSSPNSAVRNADSHEYFAENTPSLSMPKPDTTNPDPDPDPGSDPTPEPIPEPEPPTINQIIQLLLLEDVV